MWHVVEVAAPRPFWCNLAMDVETLDGGAGLIRGRGCGHTAGEHKGGVANYEE